MFVSDYMTTSPITINRKTSVQEAISLLRKNKIRQLPVSSKNEVVGLITERELLAVSPSPATTLSVYEMKELISKLTVGEIMTRNPLTVAPDCTIEEAALLMRENKISALLVMKKENLVGIITESDIFEALIKLFGLRKAGTRLVIEGENRRGLIAEITAMVKEAGISVIGIAVMEKSSEKKQVMLRLSTVEPQTIVLALQQAGFKIITCC